MTAVISKNLDPKKYGRLLSRALPSAIKTEAENERMLAEVWQLMKKGEAKLTAEEAALLELMAILIEKFEEENYPIDDAPAHEVLKMLMQDRGLKAKDLIHIFGSSLSVSQALNGKRPITKEQAKVLGKLFHVSADVFL